MEHATYWRDHREGENEIEKSWREFAWTLSLLFWRVTKQQKELNVWGKRERSHWKRENKTVLTGLPLQNEWEREKVRSPWHHLRPPAPDRWQHSPIGDSRPTCYTGETNKKENIWEFWVTKQFWWKKKKRETLDGGIFLVLIHVHVEFRLGWLGEPRRRLCEGRTAIDGGPATCTWCNNGDVGTVWVRVRRWSLIENSRSIDVGP